MGMFYKIILNVLKSTSQSMLEARFFFIVPIKFTKIAIKRLNYKRRITKTEVGI